MAQKIEVEFELKYKEAVKNLDEFQKEYAKLEKEVVKANEKTADALQKVEKGCKGWCKGYKESWCINREPCKSIWYYILVTKSI